MMTSKMIWAIIMLGYFWVVLGNFNRWFWCLPNLWGQPRRERAREGAREGADVRK